MDDLQRQVQDAVDQLVDSGAERGVQVAVYLRGEQGAAGEVAGIVTKAVTRG